MIERSPTLREVRAAIAAANRERLRRSGPRSFGAYDPADDIHVVTDRDLVESSIYSSSDE